MNGALIASGIQVGLGGLLLLFGSGPAVVAAFVAALVPPGRRLLSAAVVWGLGLLAQCVFLLAGVFHSRNLAMALAPGVGTSMVAAIGMYIRARATASDER